MVRLPPGPPVEPGPPVLPRSTMKRPVPRSAADRAARTRALLDLLDYRTDTAQRRRILEEVAVLNADLADSLAHGVAQRCGSTPAERATALQAAREAYVRAVLTLELPGPDLLTRVAPMVRDAVLAALRSGGDHGHEQARPPAPRAGSSP